MSRRFSIGREKQCDVAVFDDSVSRLHAEIWLAEDGSLMMSDCGSVNGTTVVRGQLKFPLRQEVMLPGDMVRMGGVMLSVQEMVETIEARNPGALTPRAAHNPPAFQPPGAHHSDPWQQAVPTPAPGIPPPPPLPSGYAPPPPPHPPPFPHAAGPASRVVRCECGAIKTQGQPCPVCQR